MLFVLGVAATPSAAEDCSAVQPWINEIDYDSDDGGFNDDRDEFVEIAAPAGTDLGGWQIVSVEGNSNLFSFCLTPAGGPTTGEAHFSAAIPSPTIVGNDNGTGVGFLAVCFSNTSANVEAAGDCDVVLPAPAVDSNLRNGHLENSDPVLCPDGVLLVDPTQSYWDATSWEGLVPAVGTWGPFFGTINAGIDVGDTPGVSIQKTTSAAARAFVSSEWSSSGGLGSATPGAENPPQTILCDPVCGNGFPEIGEQCDDGNLIDEDGCSSLCLDEFCGDATLQPGLGEQCDDGNMLSEDGCSAACLDEFCSDGVVQAGLGEQCDDGNLIDEDGCSSLCLDEFCGDATLQPGLGEQCDDGNMLSEDGCSAACLDEFCSDGVVQAGLGEQCDDANLIDEDGCSSLCIDEFCGDGTLQLGLGEQCDDANLVDEDGCSSLCVLEFCGDGTTQAGLGEQCDDANLIDEDGCSSLCVVEFCGDAIVQPGLGEACDDGNGNEFDECLSTCQFNEVPTLNGWGLLGLVLLITTAGTAMLRRSRRLESRSRITP